MSANLETVGVATADVSKVIVTSQEVSSADLPKIPGKSGSSGMTMVCCSDTTVPHDDKIPMTTHVGTVLEGRADKVTSCKGSPPIGEP
jgi:hypothetical protein